MNNIFNFDKCSLRNGVHYIYDDPTNPIYSPSINITTTSTSICSGSSSTLTASGASTYVWTDISGSTILSTNALLTVSPTTTTTYLVTGTDAGGCTGTNSITITVNPQPIVTVTSTANNNTVCPGEMTTLTASGALSYLWTPNSTLTASPNPSITADVVPTSSTTYFVTGTDLNGCSSTSAITINVNPNCCNYPGDVSSIGANSTSIGSSFPNSIVYINGNFTVNNNFTINLQTVELASNVKIIILSGATLNITRSKLYSCGTDMWDGIEIQSGGNLNIINNSLIEDAKIGVLSDNSTGIANFLISRTTFNRNHIGVKVINHTTGTAHPGSITTTKFDSQPSATSTSNISLLDAPYSSQSAEIGVELFKVNSITIGSAALATNKNRFGLLKFGIRADVSTYTAINNEFKDMYPDLSIWAIYNTDCSAIIGGNLNNQPNNFENLYNGILHVRSSQLEVYNNTFTNITSTPPISFQNPSIAVFTRDFEGGIIILNGNILKDVEIGFKHQNSHGTNYTAQLNQFKDFSRWGIYGLQHNIGIIKVINNDFNQSVNSAFNGNSAINFSNAILPLSASPSLTISNNTIFRVKRGIQVVDYSKPIINNNSVTFPNTINTAVLNYGIRTLNSGNELIKANNVSKIGGYPTSAFLNNVYGISVELNASAVAVTENTVVKLGKGLRFRAYSNANSTVSCNKMNHNRVGLNLDGVNIGPQGFSAITNPPNGVSNDNQWTNPTTVPGSLSVLGQAGYTSVPFYTRSSSYPWCPSAISMFPALSILTSTNSPLVTVPNAPTNCPNICYNPPCIFFPLVRMAENQSPYNLVTGNEKYLLHHGLLKTILADSTIETDTSLDAVKLRFFRDTTLANTEMGKMVIVSDSIAKGDTTFAKNLNASIIDTKCAETYQKTVNEIYLRSWARNQFFLKPADSLTLQLISYEDPLYCGSAVFDARVMVGLDLNDFSPESRSGSEEELFEIIEGKIGILYPNPASTFCVYEAELETNQSGKIEIFDINGKMIESFSLKEGENRLEIALTSYQNGVYIFKIIVDEELIETKRLVITK